MSGVICDSRVKGIGRLEMMPLTKKVCWEQSGWTGLEMSLIRGTAQIWRQG